MSGKIKTAFHFEGSFSRDIIFVLFILLYLPVTGYSTLSDSIQNNEILTQRTSADTTLNPGQTAEEKEPVLRLRHAVHNFPSYYIYVFLAGFLIFALIRILDPQYFLILFASAANTGNLFLLFQEGRFGFNIINLLLDLIFVSVFSIIVQLNFFPQSPGILGWIIIFTLGAYFFKIILIQLSAYLFFDKTDALLHVLMHLHFTRLLSIIMLPIVFFCMYQAIFPLQFLIELIFYFLLFIYIIWLLKLLVKMKIEGISGVFYLFLYLCAIEISPVLILIKDFIL